MGAAASRGNFPPLPSRFKPPAAEPTPAGLSIGVIRVRRPETIAAPAVRELILRAIEETPYPGTTPQALYDELAARIQNDLRETNLPILTMMSACLSVSKRMSRSGSRLSCCRPHRR